MKQENRFAPVLAAALMIATVTGLPERAGAAQQGPGGEFIVFPSIINRVVFKDRATGEIEHRHIHPEVDFFATLDYRRLRILGEYMVGDEKTHGSHLTRFQLGWKLDPDNDVWLGRFHNPLGYWNTQYHHGKYLETSANRPTFLRFEEDGGFLPLHISGIYLDGGATTRTGRLQYTLALGKGPVLVQGELKELEIFGPNEPAHELGGTMRFAWQHNEDSPNLVGVFAAYQPIPINPPTGGELEQTVAGVFGNWETGRARLFGSAFHVRNDLPGDTTSDFTYAYLQGEYYRWGRWIPYGRLEGGRGVDADPYLAMFPEIFREEATAGLRYDFLHNQSLKFEYARAHPTGHHYDHFTFQWSASYP